MDVIYEKNKMECDVKSEFLTIINDLFYITNYNSKKNIDIYICMYICNIVF